MTSLELMSRYVAAARRGDWDSAFGFFADDIVIHVPGRSPLAGTHEGREGARRYIEAALAVVHGGEVQVELVEMLAGPERVVLIVTERFSRGDSVVEIHRANAYRIRGCEISEISIFEANQYAVDAMFAHCIKA